MIRNKIMTRDALIPVVENLRSQGRSIGFTSGVYDLIHAGHIDYLFEAKALCDVLIVGVNADVSVKKYKGGNRPVVGEAHRLKVLSALEMVDFVFLFNERRNRINIEALKPDFYIKAGDYTPETLTSGKIVEQYGGKVKIIPVTEEISSTLLIEKFLQVEGLQQEEWVEKGGAVYLKKRPPKQSPAVFLDRDGTINKEVLYLHEPEKLKFIDGVLEGVRKFQDMGYRIVILTNQPGIGLGYFSKEDFYRVTRVMLAGFSKAGILVDKIYFCPHSKSEGCDCRKPGQALIQRAQDELNLDLSKSVIIGDKTSDIETGRRAGMRTMLVKTGFAGKDGEFSATPDLTVNGLAEAADLILKKERE